MWIYFILGGWGWGGHSTNHRGLLLLLVLSVKALSLLISLTCPEAGILAGIFSVISFCTHILEGRTTRQGRGTGSGSVPHTRHSFSTPRPKLGPGTDTGSFLAGQETGGHRAWGKVSGWAERRKAQAWVEGAEGGTSYGESGEKKTSSEQEASKGSRRSWREEESWASGWSGQEWKESWRGKV